MTDAQDRLSAHERNRSFFAQPSSRYQSNPKSKAIHAASSVVFGRMDGVALRCLDLLIAATLDSEGFPFSALDRLCKVSLLLFSSITRMESITEIVEESSSIRV